MSRAKQLQAGPASWRARQGNSSKGCPCRQHPWSTSDSRGSRPSIQHALQPHHCAEGGRGRTGGLPPPQNPQGSALQVATDPPEKLLRAPASCPLPAWKAAMLQWAGPAGSLALRKGSNTQSIPIGPCKAARSCPSARGGDRPISVVPGCPLRDESVRSQQQYWHITRPLMALSVVTQ